MLQTRHSGCSTYCCSHIYSRNQVRGHRTGSSHYGVEEHPTEKITNNTKSGTRIDCIIADAMMIIAHQSTWHTAKLNKKNVIYNIYNTDISFAIKLGSMLKWDAAFFHGFMLVLMVSMSFDESTKLACGWWDAPLRCMMDAWSCPGPCLQCRNVAPLDCTELMNED